MSLIQHEYELSIWKNVWAKPTLLDEAGNVTNTLTGEEILDEEKSAILSSDNMTFPGKAINIIFKTKLNGTHELTFDLPNKYVNPDTSKKVKNYLVDLIDNETIVKLKYRDKWYSFYVKKITEKREKIYTTFSYSCEDSFISELSKIGYKLTFDENTEHYVETIHTFANDILDGSEWKYNKTLTKENCDLREYKEDRLIIYTTNQQTTLRLLTNTKSSSTTEESISFHHLYDTNSTIIVPSGTILYGFYSEYNNDILDRDGTTKIKQVIYVPNSNYFISGNTIDNKNCNYIVEESHLNIPSPVVFHNDNRYGLKIIYNEYTEYNKELKRYVKRYTSSSGDFYSYTKTHIMVPAIAQNYAANHKDMTNTTGWAPYNSVDKLTVGKLKSGTWFRDENGIPYLDINNYASGTVSDGEMAHNALTQLSPNVYGIVASECTPAWGNNSNKCAIVNTGPYSRKLTIDSPTTFAIRMDYTWAKRTYDVTDITNTISEPVYNTAEGISSNYKPTIKICTPIVGSVDSYYQSIVTEASALDDDGNYNLKAKTEISNINSGTYYLIDIDSSLLSNGPLTNLFIVIEFNDLSNQDNYFCIQNLEFFEAWTYDGKHTIARSNNTVDTSDIVPTYLDPQNGWIQGYVNFLRQKELDSSLTSNTYSPSAAYTQMENKLNEWITLHTDSKYTLVTENSIVSGKSFLEEIYFKLKQNTYVTPYGKNNEIIYFDPGPSSGYEQWYNCEKYRTLKQSKSNRFNLSQQLSSLFHVYPVYEIEYYPNGKVKRNLYDADDNLITTTGVSVAYSQRKKWLYYTDKKGGVNKYGFKYGHNLSSISRTVDSANIVTKMFVVENLSEYAKDGICTIARAPDNIGKDDYLLNFEYLINRKIVTREKINKDLYSTQQKADITFPTWGTFIQDGTKIGYKYNNDLQNYDNYGFITPTYYEGFLYTVGKINSRYDNLAYEQALLEKYQLVVLEASVKTYKDAVNSLREQLAKQRQLAAAYVQEKTNKKASEYRESCERIATKLQTYEIYLDSAQCMYEIYADLYNKYKCEMRYLLYCKKKLEDNFNRRYETLIKEGVWQDSKYLDDNTYYLDAEKVISDSCGAKINYNLTVADLSVLEKYQFTDFSIGDVTYVEDYEFFDDDLDTSDKFYLEKTIVSSISCNLDNPSKNSITLQNYSTKFDDLFSRITASVQSLTFNENIYQRAAKFTTNGQVDPSTLQETLTNNDFTIVGTQEVVIDQNGILVTDLRIPSNKVKIVGSGVYITGNGGATWSGAFENGGINASALTVGSINTASITITNQNYTSFVWDKDGITAYGNVVIDDKNKTTSNSYVRFNHNGLYFVNNEAADFDTGIAKASKAEITDYIMENAAVAITSKGFSIQSKVTGVKDDDKEKAEAKRSIKFTSEDGLVMSVNNETVLQLGFICGLTDKGVNDFWGLKAQGAYIEGTLVSEYIGTRKVKLNTENSNTMYDISSTKLRGGRLEISRSVVDTSTNTATFKPEKIVTMGTSILKATSTDPVETGEEVDAAEATTTTKDYIGSSIRIHEKGSYWCITTPKESGEWTTRILYAKDDLGTQAVADSFKVYCKMFLKEEPTISSDISLKKNVKDIDNRYIKLFDKLTPKLYNLNDEETGAPLHLGLIAQDVQEAFKQVKLSNKDFGAVRKISKDKLGLNYIELLTLAIAKIKSLEEEIKQLKK